LCEAASVQCDAGGAAVLKAVRHEGEVVAASGLLAGVADTASRSPLARSRGDAHARRRRGRRFFSPPRGRCAAPRRT